VRFAGRLIRGRRSGHEDTDHDPERHEQQAGGDHRGQHQGREPISVLFAVTTLERPSQQEISTAPGIDRRSVSKTIDGRGLRPRDPPRRPRHRRRNWIELTEQAAGAIADVRRLRAECDAEFLAPLSEHERRQLARLLRKLTDQPPS
jgi:hypothetical protein